MASMVQFVALAKQAVPRCILGIVLFRRKEHIVRVDDAIERRGRAGWTRIGTSDAWAIVRRDSRRRPSFAFAFALAQHTAR